MLFVKILFKTKHAYETYGSGLHFLFASPKRKWRKRETRLRGDESPLRTPLRWNVQHSTVIGRPLSILLVYLDANSGQSSSQLGANHLYKARFAEV